MGLNKFGIWVILVVLATGLVAVFAAILGMRFSPGDIYPHYSTKRSDPLGARAFYESLEKLRGVEVARNVVSLQRIKGLDNDTTLMLLGVPHASFRSLRATDDSPVLEAVRKGTRLVIAMNPGYVPLGTEKSDGVEDWIERREKLRKRKSGEGGTEQGKEGGGDDEGRQDDSDGEGSGSESESGEQGEQGEPLAQHLEFRLTVPEEFKRPEEGWEVKDGPFEEDEAEGDGLPLPEVFPNWRSQYRIDGLGDAWRTIAVVEGEPVVVERPYGEGWIVLASDCYFASNEALWKGEDTAFLWWLVGGRGKVVFDETIHGSVEKSGMMKLIRRYRLHGFFAGLFVFLGLFAWSSGSSLVPGSGETERGLIGTGEAVTGEDASSGMVRLLRRNVSPNELLEKCVGIWREGDGGGGASAALTAEQEEKVAELLRMRKTKPKQVTVSDGYQSLVKVLSRRG